MRSSDLSGRTWLRTALQEGCNTLQFQRDPEVFRTLSSLYNHRVVCFAEDEQRRSTLILNQTAVKFKRGKRNYPHHSSWYVFFLPYMALLRVNFLLPIYLAKPAGQEVWLSNSPFLRTFADHFFFQLMMSALSKETVVVPNASNASHGRSVKKRPLTCLILSFHYFYKSGRCFKTAHGLHANCLWDDFNTDLARTFIGEDHDRDPWLYPLVARSANKS